MASFGKYFLALSYCFLVCQFAVAQLTVTYPFPRMVVQRNQQNTATLYIAGMFSIPIDQIEVRLTAPDGTSRAPAGDWTILQNQPQNGYFQGSLTASAGLYRLEVRGIRSGQTVSSTFVPSVGIGEVFMVAGQSNAMGLPNLGAKGASEWVVAFDAWNRFWNKNDVLESSDKPFPTPTFMPMSSTGLVFPTGETAWCWGELGDYLASQYGVPVAFFNVAIPATIADNWSSTSKGVPAKNIFNSTIWPFLQPYSNLKNTLQYYHSQFGIRAILWHHGESDAVPLHTSTATYRQAVQTTIDQSRVDFGANVTWVVAQSTITPAGPIPNTEILEAQRQLAAQPGNNVWAGPYTDDIQSPRPAHGHFQNIPNGVQGISEFASAWKTNLSSRFFQESLPHQPQQFIRTGLLPSEIPAGSALTIPYTTFGYAKTPNVVVQLLNENGWFVSEIGRASTPNSIQTYLPDTLKAGRYYARVVATNPILPGTPSLPFQITAPTKPRNPFVEVQIEPIDSTTTNIHWLTAQEMIGSRFFVEWMDTNGTYHTIGTVDAKTDGELSHLYSFVDHAKAVPDKQYRIRLEQPNGQVLFGTKIVLGVEAEPIPQPTIYPNPNNGATLTISVPESGEWDLNVVNFSGQTIRKERINASANSPTTLSLTPKLPAGLYMLRLQRNNRYSTVKMLVQQ